MNMGNLNQFSFVSVVIPVYNAEDTIFECLKALKSQTYPADLYEIIIVDNNSTDQSIAIVRKFSNVSIYEEKKRQSSYASRNTGIEYSNGEWIAFTDSDCIAQSDWLEQMVIASQRNHSIVGVAGETKAYKPKSIIELYQSSGRIFSPQAISSIHDDVIPFTCNVMYKREVLQAVGRFNGDFVSGGDQDLAYRILSEHLGKIILNRNAVILHKHRTRMIQFWRQYIRYGMGKRHLQDLHHSVIYGNLRINSLILYIIVGLPYEILKTLIYSFQGVLNIRPFYETLFPWLEYIEGIALRLGLLKKI